MLAATRFKLMNAGGGGLPLPPLVTLPAPVIDKMPAKRLEGHAFLGSPNVPNASFHPRLGTLFRGVVWYQSRVDRAVSQARPKPGALGVSPTSFEYYCCGATVGMLREKTDPPACSCFVHHRSTRHPDRRMALPRSQAWPGQRDPPPASRSCSRSRAACHAPSP